MWRRPTESGISFICILAPTRFFVKSIKINIARRGLKIPLPASFFSPLSSFWQAKNSLLFLPHRLRQTRLLDKKNARRGLKISSPASSSSPLSSFWPAKNSNLSLPHRLSQTSLLEKKCTPRGAFFHLFTKPYF